MASWRRKGFEPSGFDHWEVIRGQGEYWDPTFISEKGIKTEEGYATDIITDKTIKFIDERDKNKPFFAMFHHNAPHRAWECDTKHEDLYSHPVKVPETFSDDYQNRAKAVLAFRNRVRIDMTYKDLGLVQPEGGRGRVGDTMGYDASWVGGGDRKVPHPDSDEAVRKMVLMDRRDGKQFRFESKEELAEFKYQRRRKC